MPRNVAPSPFLQFFDDNGDPLDGGLLYTYASGTETPLATYAQASGGSANANPVVLDAAGRATVFLQEDQTYTFVLKTAAGVTVETVDGIEAWSETAIEAAVDAYLGGIISAYWLTVLDEANAADSRTALGISYPVDFVVAVSDETTALTTGTAKRTFRLPRAMTLSAVRASVNTVSSSGVVQVDINKNGTTIFSTELTIDANEKTSATAATPAVLSTTSFAADDEITVDIVAAGTGAKGLKLAFVAVAA